MEQKIKIKDISEDTIQEVRARIMISDTGHCLHDCVPMFFGARPPMLLAMRYKGIQQEDIVYVLVDWDILKKQDVWFTDGNARSDETSYFYQGEANLDNVDFQAVGAKYWGESESSKRKKQAEVLKLKQVLLDEVVAFAVYNDDVKAKLGKMLSAQKIEREILVAKEFYY